MIVQGHTGVSEESASSLYEAGIVFRVHPSRGDEFSGVFPVAVLASSGAARVERRHRGVALAAVEELIFVVKPWPMSPGFAFERVLVGGVLFRGEGEWLRVAENRPVRQDGDKQVFLSHPGEYCV